MENFNSDEVLTLEDTLKIFKCSRDTIWRWTKTKSDFPQPIKIGRKKLWFKSDIQKYMESLKSKL